jgi:hypothetical protein
MLFQNAGEMRWAGFEARGDKTGNCFETPEEKRPFVISMHRWR